MSSFICCRQKPFHLFLEYWKSYQGYYYNKNWFISFRYIPYRCIIAQLLFFHNQKPFSLYMQAHRYRILRYNLVTSNWSISIQFWKRIWVTLWWWVRATHVNGSYIFSLYKNKSGLFLSRSVSCYCKQQSRFEKYFIFYSILHSKGISNPLDPHL